MRHSTTARGENGLWTVLVLIFSFSLMLTALPEESSAQVSTFPHNESFENSANYGPWGAWSAGPRTSNPRWDQDNNTTGSSNTGPSGPQHGTYYVYLECSGGSLGDTDYLTAAFDFSTLTVPEISFYYHMYGSTMGTLAVEASPDNGANWIQLWSISGQQHSSMTAAWTQKTLSLCPFAGLSNVLIRFAGTRGSNYYSDMAVDNVTISNGTSNPASYTSSTATQNNTAAVSAGQMNQEILGVEITATGVCPQTAVTSFTFNTSGTTNTGDITNARLWYTGPSDVFATAIQYGSTIANPGGTMTFTDNIGVSGGTNHFWLSYDVDPNATSGNQLDAQFTSVTVGGIPRTPTVTSPAGSRTIISPLSGMYTIDPNGTGSRNYTSFNAAIADLSAAGVMAPVTFQVAAGTYNEQVTIPPILGTDMTNTVTFDGGTGNASSRILTYNTSSGNDYVVRLDGADHIVFRNLTVTANGSTYGYGFHLTNEADYNEISDCLINVPLSSSTESIGILGGSPTSYSSTGDWAEYNLVKNNTITGGYYGIRFNGQSSSGDQAEGNRIHGNVVKDWYYYGVYMYYQRYTEIIDNEIIVRSNGSSSSYGLYVYYPQGGPKVIGNTVVAQYRPLYFYRANYYGPSGMRAKVVNNMFSALKTSGTVYLAYIYYNRDVDIWFNSFFMRSNSSSYGLYLYGSSGYDYDVRNNWVVDLGTSGDSRLIYNSNDAMFTTFDYNAFYSTSSSGNMFRWDGTYYDNFAQLPKTTFNANSVYGNPYFFAADDLHSNSHVGYQAGTPIAAVTTDIDGDTRLNPPCIGADEYPAPPPEYDMQLSKVLVDYAMDKWVRLEGSAEHTVKVVLENTGLSANPTSVDIGYADAPMSNPGDADVLETVSPNWSGKQAVVEFSAPLTGLPETPAEMVYARVFWSSDTEPVNDQDSDTHQIFNTKYHGYENFDGYETPHFSYFDGFLDMPWTIVDNNGGEQPVTAPGVGVGGTTAVYMNDPGNPADEWIISPGADLLAAASFRAGFVLENMSTVPVTIELAWGSSPNPGAMTTFATFASIGQGTYTAKDLWLAAGEVGDPYFNTPPTGGGIYYLGIHVISTTPGVEWSLDNIRLDDNPSPPPKTGFALAGSAIDDFIDDDSDPILVTATYKQPGLINKTFQVATTTNIYGVNGDFLWDVETSDSWITITKENPEPTLMGYNFTPPRPRQFQTFTMSVDPSGMAPGVHTGHLTFYGILFNEDFPPPTHGLVATNQPLVVEVQLRITDAGKGGTLKTVLSGTLPGPFTVPGSPYHFVDGQTGDPIATLHVTQGQIDELTIRCYPNQLPQNLARMLYVKRYWQFDYTGSGWMANVDFPYADHEASMVMDRNQLRGVRQPVPLGGWEDPIMGTTSTSDPLHNSVTVNDLDEFSIQGSLALAQPYTVFLRDGDQVQPTFFALEQNFPNPFNPSTTIAYSVSEERHVRLAVHNSLGVEVAVLVNETLPAGRYEASFDATDLPSGTYIYRMTAGDFTTTRSMTLSK